MKIILAGGGTGGPAIPLLAVAQELRKLDPAVDFLFIGTKDGPELAIVSLAGIRFISIPAGKFRRYFSFKNILDVFNFASGLVKSRRIIKDFKPDLVLSVGGYVAVP